MNLQVFPIINPDSAVRAESSSGGFFSMLALDVIKNNGIVYGIGFNKNWDIVPIRINKESDLKKLRGSKYAFAKQSGITQEIRNDLGGGNLVLFSGTPCQIASVKKTIGDHPNLILVEIICHGAPHHEYWERYLTEICNKKKYQRKDISYISFRDKCTGWRNFSFTIKFKDGSVISQTHMKNIYMRSFLQNYTLKDGCFHCPFKYPIGSMADITIGDFWGVDKILPDTNYNEGVSIAIARTEQGYKYTKKYIVNSVQIAFEQVAKYNPALIMPVSQPDNRKSFKYDAKNSESIIKVMNRYAGVSLFEHIRVLLSKFKRKIYGIIRIH